MQLRHTFKLALAVGAVALSAHTADAAFVSLEDFEDVTVGANLASANAGESFSVVVQSGQSPSVTVATAPWDATNEAMKITNPGATVFAPASLANGTTGTLFYQMYRVGRVNWSGGMTDVTPADHNFGYFESQLNVNALTGTQVFRMRDAGAFDTSTLSFDEAALYNIWHVIDNAADTTTVYLQKVTPGGSQTLLDIGGQTAFIFRNSTTTTKVANALSNVLFMTGTGSATDAAHATIYIDNIYFDASGANLSNPIPEPASAALLALAGLGLLRRRR